ncbi:hypothetical protein BCR44DRAFT_1430268 [Catenaria anguillulae PL171]|uniref:Uncharacterized protein n=1 Tax=Catenaria anguillulae PL171 TaxID=765915 RepID=A0A1Y2HWD2_9FUNG|nr:hypothetical protein BCR44DRAFT_1430268 [Catenaria anguillulae PL171]
MRKGVLALTGIQVFFGFLFMGLSIMVMNAARKANLDKDFTAEIRDRTVAVSMASAIIFGFQGAWSFFGFASALKRWVIAFKVFAIITLLSALANVVYTMVKRSFGITAAVFFAISLYFCFVYYRYAAVAMPEEIEEEKNGGKGYAV